MGTSTILALAASPFPFPTGGDPGLFNSTRNMYANEDQIREMDVQAMRPMFAYIQKAAASAGIKLPGQ